METKKNTIWNKKKFSDTPGETIDPDFQTINMIQKIKRVKKQKKGLLNIERPLENYKNIETLQNIYDKDLPQEKPVIEGLNLPDDDYDGIEKPYNDARPDNLTDALIDFIDSCFAAIDKFNKEKAQLIADIFSHKTSTKQDVKLLQKYIALFETIGISYFVAYNWFFYLFYDINYDPTQKTMPDSTKGKERPTQPTYSHKEVNEASRKYPIIDLWLWFGEFVIIFTEYFQWIMLTIIPFFFTIFNYKTCFIFLFLSFIYLLFNFLPALRNLLVDSLTMNTENKIVMAFLIIFVIMWAPSAWFPAKSDRENDQASAANYQNVVTRSWFILIPFILYKIVRAFFVIYLTVPLGAVGLGMYVLFYSFFGVLSYYFFNIFKAYTTFNNMYIYIKDGEFRYFSEEQKENFNIVQKFAVVVNNFFESLHRYILFIVYLIMLLVAAVDYAYYIRAPLLKINMLIISFVLSIICFSMILSNFINHANNDENA